MGFRLPVRHSLGAALAGLFVLAGCTATAAAEDTFVCADGSTVIVDDHNRAEFREHPCVKAWFAGDSGRQGAGARTTADVSHAQAPVVFRGTQRRAAATPDQSKQPGYAARRGPRTIHAPARTGTEIPAPARNAARLPTTKLGVIIKLPQ